MGGGFGVAGGVFRAGAKFPTSRAQNAREMGHPAKPRRGERKPASRNSKSPPSRKHREKGGATFTAPGVLPGATGHKVPRLRSG